MDVLESVSKGMRVVDLAGKEIGTVEKTFRRTKKRNSTKNPSPPRSKT